MVDFGGVPTLENIEQHVRVASGDAEFPFESVIKRIETVTGSRITWAFVEKAPRAVQCYTHVEQIELSTHEYTDVYRTPCHNIVLCHSLAPTDPSQLSARLLVGHELGHILMHFNKHAEMFLTGTLPDDVVTEQGVVRYSKIEEAEATLFSVLLCLTRGTPSVRAGVKLDAVLGEIHQLCEREIGQTTAGEQKAVLEIMKFIETAVSQHGPQLAQRFLQDLVVPDVLTMACGTDHTTEIVAARQALEQALRELIQALSKHLADGRQLEVPTTDSVDAITKRSAIMISSLFGLNYPGGDNEPA